ncbi:MAG: hypothetical protein K2M83_01880 [Muribaculaceae bacterium]|nr:hypothetical protein [Muribaculaceae bacterium]
MIIANIPINAKSELKSIVISDLLNNKTPIENYWILYRTHVKALKDRVTIDYSGIDSLKIEIPQDAIPIPIPNGCDFKGINLIINNNEKDFELFIIKNRPKKVSITSGQIDNGNFKEVPELKSNIKLLMVTDSIPWINERIGTGKPHYRKDVFTIKNGISNDSPIQPYSDTLSQPYGIYVELDNLSPTVISNINIIRSQDSSYKTLCFHADYQYNLIIRNISIETPESKLYGDQAIRIRNSINVLCENISIKGTYSQKDKWGYGIALDNVRNSKFINLTAYGKWGIFGTNNITNISIFDSDINRFDIHCYGKDVYIENTTFRNLRNLVSSFFGYIKFIKCKFIKFQPLLIRDSYRINTKFDVIFNKCQIEWFKPNEAIISTGKSLIDNKSRKILQKVEWPNLYIYNTSIKTDFSPSSLILYNSSKDKPIILDTDLKIKIRNLTLDGFQGISLCNNELKSRKSILLDIKHIDVMVLKRNP